VKYNGKVYYVYPTAKKDQIYVDTQAQFNAYKQALKARQLARQGQQQMAGTPDIVEETAGPTMFRLRNLIASVGWAWNRWGIGKESDRAT